MWLFEKRGFVSVVAYDPKKDRNSKSEFRNIAKSADTHLLIRARIKEDLDWLKTVQPNLVVETDAGADYAYRCVLTRKKFKKALAQAVDGIDYDSHFKEVARDNSPKAQGRYSAMMSCWSAMANLQPISPWSGNSWYGSGYGSSKSGSTGSTKVGSQGTLALPKASVIAPGYDTLEEFYEAVKAGDEPSYRSGDGPRHGLTKGMRVRGYFGAGEVFDVEERMNGADMVTVKTDEGDTKKFVSNYMIPEVLPEVEDSDVPDPADFLRDLDTMYDWLKQNTEVVEKNEVPDYILSEADDDAFELLTRVQEYVEQRANGCSVGLINEVYDEILWETSDDTARKRYFSDGTVPPKYESEAVALFSKE